MFENMRLVILFDMLFNPSFKMTTSFTNIARTTASASTNAGKYGTERTPYLDSFHAVPWLDQFSSQI